MNFKSIAIPLTCLVVGLLVGRLLPGSSPDSTAGDSGEVSAINIHRNTRAERLHVATSARETKRTTSPSAEATVPVPEDHGAITVPASLISSLSLAAGTRKIEQDLFSGDGMVEEALQITDHEKASIQTAWRASLRKIRDIEVASMRSEEIDEWSVRITVPDLSSSMPPLEENFRSAVHRSLGENRAQAFLAAKQVDGMFAPPVGDRFYTVTSESIGDGRWRYRMTLEDPEGTRVWVGGNIPHEILHLTDAARVQPTLNP